MSAVIFTTIAASLNHFLRAREYVQGGCTPVASHIAEEF